MKRTPKPSNPYRVRRHWPWTAKVCDECGGTFKWQTSLRWQTWFSSSGCAGYPETHGWTFHYLCPGCCPSNSAFDQGEAERREKVREDERSTRRERPTAYDDIDRGFMAGAIWRRRYTDEAWLCTDASKGNAVWRRIDHDEIKLADHVEEWSKMSGRLRVSERTVGIRDTSKERCVAIPKRTSEPVTYSATGANNDLCSALESIGANPAEATLNEIVEAMNKVNLYPGFTCVASEDGRSYSAIPNKVGTSHVEIVPWSHEGKTREELVERIEFLDRLSDEQIDLNERREDWFGRMYNGTTGLVHDVYGEHAGMYELWATFLARHPWPTEDNAPETNNEPDKE